MSSTCPAPWVVALCFTGCLEGGPPGPGRQIVADRDVDLLQLASWGGRVHLLHDRPGSAEREVGDQPRPAVDLWAVDLAGGTPRRLVLDHAPAWPARVLALTPPQLVATRRPRTLAWDSAGRELVDVASLTVVDLATGQGREEPSPVSGFGVAEDGRIYTEAFLRGSPAREVTLLGPLGQRRPFGEGSAARFGPDGNFYVVRVNDGTLLRIGDPGAAPLLLRAPVTHYDLTPDGRFAVVESLEKGRSTFLAYTLATLAVRNLMLPPRCRFLGLLRAPPRFACAEPPADQASAWRVHVAELERVGGDSVNLPTEQRDVETMWSPPEGDVLVLGGAGHLTTVAIDAAVIPPRTIAASPTDVRFLPEQVLILDERQATSGTTLDRRLLAVERAAPAASAPRHLSPQGASVRSLTLLGPGDRVLFLADHGDDRPALFAVHAGTGGAPARVVAEAVGAIAVGSDRLLALVRRRFQDGTGELAIFDGDGLSERVLAHRVVGFVAGRGEDGEAALAPGAPLVYVSRDREPSAYDGAWLSAAP